MGLLLITLLFNFLKKRSIKHETANRKLNLTRKSKN
jgi:hypothetical protein